MNKTTTSLLVGISSSLLIYINSLVVMFLLYYDTSLFIFRFAFFALFAIGIIISSVAILYNNHSVLQSAL